MEMKISPSILSADVANIQSEVQRLLDAYPIDMLHLDIMDGFFAPNISFGVPIVAAIRRHFPDLTLDVHLMLENPLYYVPAFAGAGADIITIHAECDSNVRATIAEIKRLGLKAGIALRPRTAVNAALPFINDVDMVLQMLVDPGFGGQELIESALENVRKLRAARADVDLQVDGGVNEKNAALVRDAGANVIVSGSGIFGANNMELAINNILGN